MRKLITISMFLVVVGCYCSVSLSVKGQSASSNNIDLAIVGARIYPSPTEKPIPNGVVLIRNGRITAVGQKGKIKIPPRSRVLDCTGLTLTSGFWNSHVHFIELKWENSSSIPASKLSRQLEEMLTKHGFTTVFDTGSSWAETSSIRKRIEAGEVNGPRIFTVGEILSAKGGLTPALMKKIGFLPDIVIEIGTLEEGTERAKQQLEKGVDAVKIYAATTVETLVEMPPEVVKAIVNEAHRGGKLAFVHPHNANGLEAAINGGVDVLVHTIPNAGKLSQEQIARMKRNRMALIPTLKLWTVEATREGMPSNKAERFVNAGVEQLREYSQAGGQIIFGTDVGYIDYDPTEEYVLMERAGMNFRQILESLTTAPAERFGLSKKTARVAPGMEADIVILGGDPATDVKAFSTVRYTMRAGKVIYQSIRRWR
jgi:imidazolonepropionase-like amidohydrolase